MLLRSRPHGFSAALVGCIATATVVRLALPAVQTALLPMIFADGPSDFGGRWFVIAPGHRPGMESAHKYAGVARDGDVIVATYARAGTHMFAILCAEIIGHGNSSLQSLPSESYSFEWYTYRNVVQEREHLEPHQSRFILTHVAASLQEPLSPKAQYLIAVRDPVDAFASLTRMLWRMTGDMIGPTLAASVHKYAALRPGWPEWHAEWWRRAQKPRVRITFLQFEDYLTNRTSGVLTLASFLGVSLTAPQLRSTLQRTSYEYEQEHGREGIAQGDRGANFLGGHNVSTGMRAAEVAEMRLAMRRRLAALGAGALWPTQHREVGN